MQPRNIVILIATLCLVPLNLCAETDYTNGYPEDTVSISGKPVQVRIDAGTGKVVSYYDDETKSWLDASLSQSDLNKAYQENVQLAEMQSELNEMKNNTWDDRYHGDRI